MTVVAFLPFIAFAVLNGPLGAVPALLLGAEIGVAQLLQLRLGLRVRRAGAATAQQVLALRPVGVDAALPVRLFAVELGQARRCLG